MKVSAVLFSLLTAASALDARSLLGAQNAMVNEDPKLKVPGKNPLYVGSSDCELQARN